MINVMKKVIAANASLSDVERNMLSVAYKNTIGPLQAAWRSIDSREKKGNLGLLKDYKKKIEGELDKYCNEILNLIDSQLLPKAAGPEAEIFYCKMKGDYYKYISEFTYGDKSKKAANNAYETYKAASENA